MLPNTEQAAGAQKIAGPARAAGQHLDLPEHTRSEPSHLETDPFGWTPRSSRMGLIEC